MTGIEIIPLLTGVAIDRALPDNKTASEVIKRINTDTTISQELETITTEFDQVLGERIKDRAEEIENFALHSLGVNWDVISINFDVYEVISTSESEAIECIIQKIDTHEDVDLDESARDELRMILAEEFTKTVDDFINHIAENDELANRFHAELEIDIRKELQELRTAFDQFINRNPYTLYSFPTEREAIIESLLPGDPFTFVNRSEVPDQPKPGQKFVLGPSGSGKTRIIAERIRRLPQESIAHVIRPDERLVDPSDAKALSQESFDGDVLLVWEDVHRIDENRENAVLDAVIHELRENLEGKGYSLYTLLEAQSGQLDNVPGNLPADFENDKSLWSDFEPIWVGTLDGDTLREIAEEMATALDVTLKEAAQEQLIARTVTSKSAPAYLETAITTATDQLTIDKIEDLPDNTADIWLRQYDSLQDEAPDEWRVLAAMKLAYDLRIPYFAKLVRAIYIEVLDGDRGGFRTAIQSLNTKRHWLSIGGDDRVTLETQYYVHDTQIEPIRVHSRDDIQVLSDLLCSKVTQLVPASYRASVLLNSGLSAYEWGKKEVYRRHLELAIEYDPEMADVHNNYASLLFEEFSELEEAEYHFKRAIEIAPENYIPRYNYNNLLQATNNPSAAREQLEAAVAQDPDDIDVYTSYASLLNEEFGKYEIAEHQLNRALEISPENPDIHFNLGRLTTNQGKLEQAASHYEQTLEQDPTYSSAHYNYANLLKDHFGEFDKAAQHYEQAIEHGSGEPEPHNNYAELLLRKNCVDEASDHLKRALEIDAELPQANTLYGNILYEEGELVDAREHFETAIDGWIDFGRAQMVIRLRKTLVDIYLSINNFDEAIEQCNAALEFIDKIPAESVSNPDGWMIWFENTKLQLLGDDVDYVEIYHGAIQFIGRGEIETALSLLLKGLDQGNSVKQSSKQYEYMNMVQVLLGAYAEMEVLVVDIETNPLSTVNSDSIQWPVSELYAWLSGDETASDAMEIQSDIDPSDESFDVLEAKVISSLVEEISAL